MGAVISSWRLNRKIILVANCSNQACRLCPVAIGFLGDGEENQWGYRTETHHPYKVVRLIASAVPTIQMCFAGCACQQSEGMFSDERDSRRPKNC